MSIAAGLLPEVLGIGNEHSQRIRLGKALTKRAGQMFGKWCIETAECRDDEGRARKRLPAHPRAAVEAGSTLGHWGNRPENAE